MKKYIAEFIGTFWLVLGGCGSAVFAAFIAAPGGGNTNEFGLGYLGVALAFGLTVFYWGLCPWSYFRWSFQPRCFLWTLDG